MKETDIQRLIIEWGRLVKGMSVWRINVQGMRGRKSTNLGMADLVAQYVFCGIPILIFFEVKTPKGKQGESQKQFEEVVKKDGGFYFLVTSIQDAQDALQKVERFLSSKISQAGNHQSPHKWEEFRAETEGTGEVGNGRRKTSSTSDLLRSYSIDTLSS